MKMIDSATKRPIFVTGEPERDVFAQNFEELPFQFRHSLAQDARFQMDRIRGLAVRLAGKISFSGDLDIRNGFRQPAGEGRCFRDALEGLEQGKSWIILKKIHKDPEYASLLGECLKEVESLTGRRLQPLIESRTMSLILSSPGQVTPYHIDADCNFLFQIRGQKMFYVFNGHDRSVLPEVEEENFWSGDLNAAKYREENQKKAWPFAMKPGTGVHVPVIFPHWVKNDENVSVSLSINFRFHGLLRGDVYRMNHFIRKVGLRPRGVGESRFADLVKVAMIAPPRAGFQLIHKMWQKVK